MRPPSLLRPSCGREIDDGDWVERLAHRFSSSCRDETPILGRATKERGGADEHEEKPQNIVISFIAIKSICKRCGGSGDDKLAKFPTWLRDK